MNRKIKFRLWDIVAARWFKSGSYEFNSGHGANEGQIVAVTFGAQNTYRKIEEFTLEQFSGVKDKNGKEIYEGDIIVHWAKWDDNAPINAIPRQVCFEGSSFVAKHDTIFQKLDQYENTTWEIIGNVHENPDLLKK